MAHEVGQLAKVLGVRSRVQQENLQRGLEMAELLGKFLPVRVGITLDEVLQLRQVGR